MKLTRASRFPRGGEASDDDELLRGKEKVSRQRVKGGGYARGHQGSPACSRPLRDKEGDLYRRLCELDECQTRKELPETRNHSCLVGLDISPPCGGGSSFGLLIQLQDARNINSAIKKKKKKKKIQIYPVLDKDATLTWHTSHLAWALASSAGPS